MDSPAAAENRSEPAVLWLTRADQWFVGTCLAVGLLLLGLLTSRATGWGRPLIEIDRHPARQYDYQLDVNSATWVEWALLDGIGPQLAKQIVADRDARGPFRSIDDVDRVRGIGPKTMDKIRPWLRVKQPAP